MKKVKKNFVLLFQLTVGPDLPSSSVGGHAGLAGTLVGSVLESDDGLAGLQNLLVELALVLARNLKQFGQKFSSTSGENCSSISGGKIFWLQISNSCAFS
jgi:hypothetical protein